MVLGVPDEEDVPGSLGFVVVQPGRQLLLSRLQAPLPQVDQRQWFSPGVETGHGMYTPSLLEPLSPDGWPLILANSLGEGPSLVLRHIYPSSPHTLSTQKAESQAFFRTTGGQQNTRSPCATPILAQSTVVRGKEGESRETRKEPCEAQPLTLSTQI